MLKENMLLTILRAYPFISLMLGLSAPWQNGPNTNKHTEQYTNT